MTGAPGTLFTELLLSKPPEALGRPAIVAAGRGFTYGDLIALVESLASDLAASGLEGGDRVLLTLPNSPEYIVAFLAVTAAGGVVVPVDGGAGLTRLQFLVEDTSASLCLHLPESEPPGPLPITPLAVHLDGEKARTRRPSSSRAGRAPGTSATGPESPAAILYTAGSTGRPKGVVLKHRQFLAIAETLSSVIGMHADHRDLILSPMTHSGGWQRVTSTLRSGGCVVVPEGTITVPLILETVRTRDVTAFFATPPLLRAIMMSPPEKVQRALGTLASIETASAPLGSQELARLMALLPSTRIFVQYGLTECSRALMFDTRAFPDKLHTVGRPTHGVSVAVAGEDGRFLEADREGEILLSAPQCAEGYWNRPELDHERFREGWLLTGDYGKLDSDGFLSFCGRRDDMINCGGHSFFPAEVEMELGTHETVRDYLIAGVPDPQKLLHQVPWVFVVPHDPERWSSEEFLGWARGRLPAHKVPRRVVVVPALPATATGKPSRRMAVQMYGPDAGTTTS